MPHRQLLAAALAAFCVGIFMQPVRAATSDAAVEPVVKVNVKDGHGSGFYIGQIGGRDLYVTAGHVVAGSLGAGQIKLGYTDGEHADINTVLVWDALYDFAIIASSDNIRPEHPLSLDCGDLPKPGTAIVALGYPLDLPQVRTEGHVASRPFPGEGQWPAEVVLADLTIAPGNSGGPLIGPDGRIVGIMVGWLAPTGFSAFVPMRRICQWLGIEPEVAS